MGVDLARLSMSECRACRSVERVEASSTSKKLRISEQLHIIQKQTIPQILPLPSTPARARASIQIYHTILHQTTLHKTRSHNIQTTLLEPTPIKPNPIRPNSIRPNSIKPNHIKPNKYQPPIHHHQHQFLCSKTHKPPSQTTLPIPSPIPSPTPRRAPTLQPR